MNYDKRPYQDRTVKAACKALKAGDSTVIASAVASGKTIMGARVVKQLGLTTLWVAHTQELVLQGAKKLRELTGKQVGILMPGYTPSMAEIQVGTIQTLLNLDLKRYRPELIVGDEVHHYEADVWGQLTKLAKGRGKSKLLGLTATPERSDGRPLGNTFDTLIVGAQYTELKEAGQVVPWTIYQPPELLGRDLALDPLRAYQELTPGQKAFVYHSRVEYAEMWAERFRDAGIYSECVHGDSKRNLRREHVRGLSLKKGGRVDVLHNVAIMTEGIDVPDVSTIILCRPFHFAGGYIQVTGRGARAAEGKTHATLIDLVGSSRLHGPPDQDWNYALDYGMKPRKSAEERQEEEKQKRAHNGYEDPAIKNTGIYLSTESTYRPQPVPTSALPEVEPPPRHAAKHLHLVKNVVIGTKGRSGTIAESVANLSSGLFE